jgi:sugar lactone lactonase YvrE
LVAECSQFTCVGNGPGDVLEFKPPYTGVAASIAKNVNPRIIACDAANHLFVTAANNPNVIYEYASPYTAPPSAEIADGIDYPAGMAFDNAGDLFVANQSANDVTEYTAPLSSAPTVAAVISANVGDPNAVTLNKSGTLFVSNIVSQSVTVYTGSAPTFTQAGTITQGLEGPDSLVTDGSGNLFVADRGDADVVQYTSFNNPAPSATVNVSGFALQVQIDSLGTIFAIGNSPAHQSLMQSSPPYSAATTTTNGLTSPAGLAVAP